MDGLQIIGTRFVTVTDKETPLDEFRCDAVLICASTRKKDNSRIAPDANGLYESLANFILWGTEKICVHELYLSKSVLIGVSNADQISVYSPAPADGQILAISFFKKRS